MQFRLTLSDDDLIQSMILTEFMSLNNRRKSEYLRRLLCKGFLAELDDIERVRAIVGNGVAPVKKQKSKASADNGVEALRGIFSGHSGDESRQ
mgnify:CR=1 FL=1